MKRSTNTEWNLYEGMTRIPESEAPNVRNGNLRVEIDAVVPRNANGVLFAMGGYAGGVSLYIVNGELRYEYSALLLKRTKVKVARLPVGDVSIALESPAVILYEDGPPSVTPSPLRGEGGVRGYRYLPRPFPESVISTSSSG